MVPAPLIFWLVLSIINCLFVPCGKSSVVVQFNAAVVSDSSVWQPMLLQLQELFCSSTPLVLQYLHQLQPIYYDTDTKHLSLSIVRFT